jgi:hypothetical protein
MLRAFVDESGFDGASPAYVVGGLVAEETVWEAFSEQWRLVMEMKPKIAYFKFDEAMGFKGQFQDWREEARNEKLMLLHAVLQDFDPIGMTCSIPCADYARVATDPRAKNLLKSPYHYLLFSFVLEWMEVQRQIGFADRRIKFVFDENVIEKKKIFDSWDELKNASYLPKRSRDLIGDTPYFENDKALLPLQAADLIVGVCRRRWMERTHGIPIFPLPSRKAASMGPWRPSLLAHEWNEVSLRETLESIYHSYGACIEGRMRFLNGAWHL